MNKNELIKKVADRSDCSVRQATFVINQALEEIQNAVADGETVSLAGFGSFVLKTREARQGRNPATGEMIEIAASKSPAFKPAKAFKDKVNG